MTIQLKEFKLDKNVYFKLLTINYFKRRWWLYTILLLIVLYIIIFSQYHDNLFISLIPILISILPVYYVIYFWRYSRNRDNNNFYLKVKIKIENGFIYGNYENGSENKLNLDNIIKVKKQNKCYLLYITKQQFIYIPKNAFTSENDIKIFEDLLKTKNLIYL